MAALTATQEIASPRDAGVAEEPAANVERERARLEALDQLDILDTPKEETFDRITRLAKKLFGVPISLVSFVDAHRQWYKSAVGMNVTEVPREGSFCRHVVEGGELLVVRDAREDPRFAANPLVTGEPYIRFYAGAPLRAQDGHNIGTLVIVDTKPREIDASQLELLRDLAAMAMDELDLRHCGRTDGLTGVLTRRAFKVEADRAATLAFRHHDDLSCIVLDLDDFKSINEAHGHTAGDLVLTGLVEACAKVVRGTDLIGRLGGEEFAILLPNTPLAGAEEAAEKLRHAIASLSIEYRDTYITLTASLGVAALDAVTRDVDSMLENADKAAREAKAAGRNRCVTWHSPVGEREKGRRRVLKGGEILFNGNMSSIDCTVRSLSDSGAGLDISSSVGVPKRFDLRIKADDFLKPCRIVGQSEKHLEVEFVSD